ncbi:type II toxin-antitoxin system RelE/ParE family toxin [Ottowia sp.]|uniref:type II toxin-antitoxin system RelE/ParE family toxin n=1 Tax=Ottowia sp. TaxID=1898956 RepID=UPI0039E5C3D0
MLSIVWTDEARVDLLEIVSYVAERNPAAAVQLGRTIEESVWPLPAHPYLSGLAGCLARAKSWPTEITSSCIVWS